MMGYKAIACGGSFSVAWCNGQYSVTVDSQQVEEILDVTGHEKLSQQAKEEKQSDSLLME